jgi:hypothetical protein
MQITPENARNSWNLTTQTKVGFSKCLKICQKWLNFDEKTFSLELINLVNEIRFCMNYNKWLNYLKIKFSPGDQNQKCFPAWFRPFFRFKINSKIKLEWSINHIKLKQMWSNYIIKIVYLTVAHGFLLFRKVFMMKWINKIENFIFPCLKTDISIDWWYW